MVGTSALDGGRSTWVSGRPHCAQKGVACVTSEPQDIQRDIEPELPEQKNVVGILQRRMAGVAPEVTD
jgi:hypothetical protein